MTEFGRLVDEFFAWWWREHPTHATSVGMHAHDGELERWDAASLGDQLRHLRDYVRLFEDATPASAGERIDRDLVLGQLRWQLYQLETLRSHERDPLLHVQPVLDALYLMAVREYAPAEDRALRAAERLAAIPRVLDEARANLVRPARVLVETAAMSAKSGVGLIEYVLSVYLGAALQDDRDQFSLWENASRAAEDALVRFGQWLEEDALPRATDEFAIGQEAFERQLRWEHALPDTAEELRTFGEALVAETTAELNALAAELNGEADWRAYARALESAPPAVDPVSAYAEAVERARRFVTLRELVSFPPAETLQVTPTPEYLRPIIPYAAYIPPAAFEAEQRGLFLATPQAGAGPRASLDGILLTSVHEAYPGHHLQFCWANRAEGTPRRVFWSPVFAEGWALYCEDLMWDEGFLEDRRLRFLQLKDRLWRACRVVVDVGLHTGGWTTAVARDYLVDEAGLDAPGAEGEVRRYCSTPTQPLSYAVGRREILRLRDRFRERAGAGFSLRAFHDELLSWGTIPPALVGRAMGLEA